MEQRSSSVFSRSCFANSENVTSGVDNGSRPRALRRGSSVYFSRVGIRSLLNQAFDTSFGKRQDSSGNLCTPFSW